MVPSRLFKKACLTMWALGLSIGYSVIRPYLRMRTVRRHESPLQLRMRTWCLRTRIIRGCEICGSAHLIVTAVMKFCCCSWTWTRVRDRYGSSLWGKMEEASEEDVLNDVTAADENEKSKYSEPGTLILSKIHQPCVYYSLCCSQQSSLLSKWLVKD